MEIESPLSGSQKVAIVFTKTPLRKVSIKRDDPSNFKDATGCNCLEVIFPLGGIFRAERHFLLFKDQLSENGRQKTKRKYHSGRKILPSGK